MRITVVCPELLRDDANNLAMVLAYSSADGETYKLLNWEDIDGNLYAAASFIASPDWINGALSTLKRPDWDTAPYIINMEGAQRAQAAIVFWYGTGSIPLATPTKITAIGGMDGVDALKAMGVLPAGTNFINDMFL